MRTARASCINLPPSEAETRAAHDAALALAQAQAQQAAQAYNPPPVATSGGS